MHPVIGVQVPIDQDWAKSWTELSMMPLKVVKSSPVSLLKVPQRPIIKTLALIKTFRFDWLNSMYYYISLKCMCFEVGLYEHRLLKPLVFSVGGKFKYIWISGETWTCIFRPNEVWTWMNIEDCQKTVVDSETKAKTIAVL